MPLGSHLRSFVWLKQSSPNSEVRSQAELGGVLGAGIRVLGLGFRV